MLADIAATEFAMRKGEGESKALAGRRLRRYHQALSLDADSARTVVWRYSTETVVGGYSEKHRRVAIDKRIELRRPVYTYG
jgi:hypothetical protein